MGREPQAQGSSIGRKRPALVSDAAQFAQERRVLLLRSNKGLGLDVALAALPYEALVIERASVNYGHLVDQNAIRAGISSQSNPFTKKKRKPQKPSRLIHLPSCISYVRLHMIAGWTGLNQTKKPA